MTSAFMQSRPGEITIHSPMSFYAGDTWELFATCNDSDGLPIDLTTASISWVLDDNVLNVFELTVGDGIALIEDVSGDPVRGQIFIELSSAKSALLAPGFYFDELTVVVGGKTLTQFRGRIEVIAKLAGPVSG